MCLVAFITFFTFRGGVGDYNRVLVWTSGSLWGSGWAYARVIIPIVTLIFILVLLNSKLINCWFSKTFPAGLHIKINQLAEIPIPVSDVSHEQIRVALASLADKMLSLNADLQKSTQRFIKRVKENLTPAKISSALESFYTMEFSDFVKELAKQKVKLSLKQQDEWEEYFAEYKENCVLLQEQINTTDAEINQLVYKLYDLTEEEISAVEGK